MNTAPSTRTSFALSPEGQLCARDGDLGLSFAWRLNCCRHVRALSSIEATKATIGARVDAEILRRPE
jgi:hypothetical protein